MKIAFHTWDSGLWSQEPNSAGGSLWIRYLFDFLRNQGHEILWLGFNEVPLTKKIDVEVLHKQADVVVLFWRWKMHKSYKDRNTAYLRQKRIIDITMDSGMPMLVHDQDHKMLLEETKALKVEGPNNVILAAPELKPRIGFHKLMYPNPYPMVNIMVNRSPFMGLEQHVYIGNNYERWHSFVEYVVKPSNLGMRTKVFGNWLEPHPDRQSPEEVKEVAPNIIFSGRLPQELIRETYLAYDCTTHLAKPSYCHSGFVTMRWAEAASAGTLGFIPKEFRHVPKELRGAIVKDGQDLYDRYASMSDDSWRRLVLAQQTWVLENMTVQAWEKLIKEIHYG